MATDNDTQLTALRRAAERVIREYHGHHEIAASESVEGIVVAMRRELAVALDDLETALDDEQAGRTLESEQPAFTVLEGDHVRDIYAMRGIAHALQIESQQGDLVYGLQGLADRVVGGLGSVPPEIERGLRRVVKVCQ